MDPQQLINALLNAAVLGQQNPNCPPAVVQNMVNLANQIQAQQPQIAAQQAQVAQMQQQIAQAQQQLQQALQQAQQQAGQALTLSGIAINILKGSVLGLAMQQIWSQASYVFYADATQPPWLTWYVYQLSQGNLNPFTAPPNMPNNLPPPDPAQVNQAVLNNLMATWNCGQFVAENLWNSYCAYLNNNATSGFQFLQGLTVYLVLQQNMTLAQAAEIVSTLYQSGALAEQIAIANGQQPPAGGPLPPLP